MKLIFTLMLLVLSLSVFAQNRIKWSLYAEANGVLLSSKDVKNSSYMYRLIDSASGTFMRKERTETKHRDPDIKAGFSAGAKLSFQLTDHFDLNIGFGFSNLTSESHRISYVKTGDSSVVVLGFSGGVWTDPQGGYYIYSPYNLNTLGWQFQFNNINLREKITINTLDFPMGTTYRFSNNKIFLAAELSPMIVVRLNSSMFPGSNGNEFTIPGRENSSVYWRFGVGAGYKLNKRLDIGLLFKKILTPIQISFEEASLSILSLQASFTMPGKF